MQKVRLKLGRRFISFDELVLRASRLPSLSDGLLKL